MGLDIIVETKEGNHLLLAEVSNRQYGAVVGTAIYEQYKDAPPSSISVRYVWLRDMSNPLAPYLMDAWPEYWKDCEGHSASVMAWAASPRGVSGDKSKEIVHLANGSTIRAEVAGKTSDGQQGYVLILAEDADLRHSLEESTEIEVALQPNGSWQEKVREG